MCLPSVFACVVFLPPALAVFHRSAHGFVDPTTHLRAPRGRWFDDPYWSGADALGSRLCAKFGQYGLGGESEGGGWGWYARGGTPEVTMEDVAACGWLLGSDFAESEREVLREMAWRSSGMAVWRQHMQERRSLSLGSLPCDTSDSFYYPGHLLQALRPELNLRSFINIGANDGYYQEDPLKWLGAEDIDWALAIEAERSLCDAYRKNFPHVQVLCEKVDPSMVEETVWPLLRKLAGAQDFRNVDILKMDIDSYDCDLLAALLRLGLRPKVIVAEVNVNIPPPFRFNWRFDANTSRVVMENDLVSWNWMYPLFGCSLSEQATLLAAENYSLVFFWDADAIFLETSLLDAVRHKRIVGPLDEYDCFQRSLLATNGVDLRVMRRWLHEVPLSVAGEELGRFLQEVFVEHIREQMPSGWRSAHGLPYSLT
eukprot:TRINITY_DN19991_c0_g1_i1.p1 TRINITY_DN19991_c0_g1~~TRINITY_DN19991_c0_g1_i1.p1  ORF type:complete len:427 (+),score=74.69 TRINITY_DN19991_c0_g1_i1:68-1348(+)